MATGWSLLPGRVLVAAAGPLASIVGALSLAAGSLPLRRPATAIAIACNLCGAIQGGVALIPLPPLRRETGLVTDGERALQLLRGSGRAQDASASTGSTLRPANVAALGMAGFHVHHEMFCRPE
jgi:hypothetical protein